MFKLTTLQRVEKAAYPPRNIPAIDYYQLWFETNTGSIPVKVDFKDIEPLILHLHGLGILGQRRYDNLGDSHLTEWDLKLLCS